MINFEACFAGLRGIHANCGVIDLPMYRVVKHRSNVWSSEIYVDQPDNEFADSNHEKK
jgi:hypothetical protein